MKETNVYTKIITDENLMETIPHGSQDYPFRYYYEHLAQFDFNCIDWHWHTELEFVYIQSGTVTAWIGEKQLELPADSGIFINSKFLHRFSSPVDAVIPNFLCMPSFLAATDSYIYQNYVKPIVTSNIPFWIFCSSHQIINANVIIVRQLDKNFSWDAACSNFIVCIAAARNLQIARKFLPA